MNYTDALISTILKNVRHVEDISVTLPPTDNLWCSVVDLAKKARAERELEGTK